MDNFDIEEQWKPVPGYEDQYMVSNIGRVKSIARNFINKNGVKHTIKEKILKTQTWTYDYVILTKDRKQKMFDIHRLVALAWVENPNPDKFTIVNHKDENIHNNCYTNLEWCDHSYNNTYNDVHKKRGEKLKGRVPWNKGIIVDTYNPVKMTNLYTKDVKYFDSISLSAEYISKKLNKDYSTVRYYIHRVLKGSRKSALGYTWEYVLGIQNNGYTSTHQENG